MKSKTIEEKEFVTIQYTIEKSKVQQRKLKNDIVTVSRALQQSKRNNVIMLGTLIVVLIIGSILMHFSNNEKMSNSDYKSVKAYGAFQEAQKVDDSLRLAVKKLTQELSSYKKEQKKSLKASVLIPSIPSVIGTENKKEAKRQFKKPTSGKYTKRSCFVNKIFKINGAVFIEANFIGEEGKPNTIKASEKVQVLQLHKKLRIHKRNGTSIRFNPNTFQKIMGDKYVLNVLIKDRIVYKITEEELL